MKKKHRNRLINEKSPYLLQHAYNPVDWYPWGKEAFDKAKREDKPIFLSIGYSTCHWCHVMEHESFEDKEIAGMMNNTFVNIKVDREERPDIDGIYMEVCQMITGSGGWPLTIIMTAEKKPFFAGTYFPKKSMYGRIGLKELISQIKDIWENRRPEIYSSAEDITNKLQSSSNKVLSANLSLLIFDKAFEGLKSNYDEVYGGFGNSPKFPIPHNLSFLLRNYHLRKNPKSLEIVEKTLYEMRNGGIYDQIGFGFHRYSTDRQWLVPHFEKMLYDQAQLLIAYAEAYQVSKNDYYLNVAYEIITYISRSMTSKHNTFFSAEDADSDGVEGKFYVWTYDEIKSVLKKDADLFIKIFNVKKDGNFADNSVDDAGKNNILHLTKSMEQWAEELNQSVDEIKDKVEKSRIKLFEYRKKRVHPFKDDKVLTDWNGLMIAALSIAGVTLDNPKFINTAKKSADFIIDNLIDENNQIFHRSKGNEFGISGNLNDYAFFTWGLIEMYQANFDIKYLLVAIKLTDYILQHFWDKEDGGFYFTADNSEVLISRKKEIYDGATPSGNSIALNNLIMLSKLTGDLKYSDKADELIQYFSGIINYSPQGYTQFLNSLMKKFAGFKEIVIVANVNKDIKPVLSIINSYYLPNKVILFKNNQDKDIEKINPVLKEMKMIENKPTIYLCHNFVCEQPITDLGQLKKILGS